MLKEGQAKIMGTETIGLIDSIQVLYPVYNLNNAVGGVAKILTDKRAMFDKAGVTLVVADRLDDEKAAAQALVTAVVAKLPAYLPGIIGTTAAQPILDKLDKVAALFKAPAGDASAAPASAAPPTAPAKPAKPAKGSKGPKW